MSKGIMVFAERDENGFHPVVYELAGKARELADESGEKVVLVAIGYDLAEGVRELLHYSVDEVLVYDAPGLRRFNPVAFAAVLEQAVRTEDPSVLLLGATPLGRSLAPRVQVRLGTGLTADCTALEMRPGSELLQIRPAFGGDIMASIVTRETRPQMATVRHKVMRPGLRTPGPSGQAIDRGLEAVGILQNASERIGRLRVLRQERFPPAATISDAQIIVACGRGVKSASDLAMFEELAGLLGGMLGVSRPLVERGWMPSSRQVGQSGRTVRPALYIACGISGAIQHIAGMSGSEVVVAINSDPAAPIFESANYAIVGDVYEIVPELNGLLKSSVGGDRHA